MNYCIRKLENDITTQESINYIYQDFACTVKSEMADRLSFKDIC